jgi:hypothetical protein
MFEEHLWSFTDKIMGIDAYHNQKEYLKKTQKPEGLSVILWINRMKNINSYLPYMKRNAVPLSDEDLIAEVITPNLPSAWVKDFKILQLDRETRIKETMQKLLIIEDQVKVERKTHRQGQEKNKHLKNPCHMHNGGHEWDDCHEIPKNKNKDKASHNDTDNRDNRGKGQWAGNRASLEENRNAESRQREHDSSHEHSRNGHRNDSSDEDYESNQRITKGSKEAPSAEIIITISKKKEENSIKPTWDW